MEKYIITFEDGLHYQATEIDEETIEALCDGLLTIIRCSDGKEFNQDEEWNDLPEWGAE